jgi:hypothetical protein
MNPHYQAGAARAVHGCARGKSALRDDLEIEHPLEQPDQCDQRDHT